MTLTEQWKKGELKEGAYYVRNECDVVFAAENYINYDCFNDTKACDFYNVETNIKEVLAPVPSYEEWQNINEFADYSIHNRNELTKQINYLFGENEKLSQWNIKAQELLKECRYKIIADLDNARLCESSVDIEDFEYLLNRIDNAIGEKNNGN